MISGSRIKQVALDRVITYGLRYLIMSLCATSLLVIAGCSKKPKTIEDTAPNAVYDGYAKSKAFPVVASGVDPMIDDLEDGDLKGLKADGRNWSWSQFDDSSDGIQVLTIQQLPDAPGAGDNVLYLKGGDWKYSGAGVNAYLVNRTAPQPFGYYDASLFSGIQFWVKATGISSLTIQITTPETTTVDDGGFCIQGCADPVEIRCSVGNNWQLIQLPFDSFTLPTYNEPGLLDPSRIKGISFSIESLNDYEVWLDELSFFQ